MSHELQCRTSSEALRINMTYELQSGSNYDVAQVATRYDYGFERFAMS